LPANFTDYLQTPVTVSGVTVSQPFVGRWVRLLSNATGTAYISTASTDTNGMFNIANLPADIYTVYSGPTNTGAWTATGDANYIVSDPNKYDARDYGAVGDGVTDDTTAIQNAINAANSAGGGNVLLSNKTYLISATLILKSNTGLTGIGPGLTTITGTFDTALVGTTQSGTTKTLYTNVMVANLTLKSSLGHLMSIFNTNRVLIQNVEGFFTVTTPIREGLWIEYCQRVFVTGCLVRDFTGDGIQINACNDFSVIGNIIDGGSVADDGIDIDSDFLHTQAIGSLRGVVSGNSIRNTPAGNAIRVEDSQYVSVTGNSVNDVTGSGNAGISVNSGFAVLTTQFITVSGNTISNCLHQGIRVVNDAGAGTCLHINVNGNTVVNCGQAGGSDIRAGLLLASTDILAADNYIQGSGGTDVNGGAIVVYKADRIRVSGNIITGSTNGIRMWNGDSAQTYTDVELINNRILSTTNPYPLDSSAIGQVGVSVVAAQKSTIGNLWTGGGTQTGNTIAQWILGLTNTQQYPHWVSTNHTIGSKTGNAIKFWTSDGTLAGAFPTNGVLGLVIDSGHLLTGSGAAPATSALGANVTSVTFTGNDRRGTIAIVMAGALAANTRIATCTYAVTYGATAPFVFLCDQTSGAGLANVGFYRQAVSTGVSFDLASNQALAAGTYTIAYIVEG
jgi:hypothetical protein